MVEYHFNGLFHNANCLVEEFPKLPLNIKDLVLKIKILF